MDFGFEMDNGKMHVRCKRHTQDMSEEEARLRGLSEKWADGKVYIDAVADVDLVLVSQPGISLGKGRPKTVKVVVLEMRCPVCKTYARFEFENVHTVPARLV